MNNTLSRGGLLSALLLFLSLLLCGEVCGDVRLPGFFGDHMVFQRDVTIPIWGWADPGESVEVTLGGTSASARSDDTGRWRVALPPLPAGREPIALRVKGNNEIEIGDVLVGEVWLCSGQSNMEWRVQQSTNGEAEVAAANYPLIRHIKVPRRPSPVPLDNIEAEWQVCSPDTAANFTAAGYFMARHLFKELDVPIGLINSSWGGTRIEPWTAPVGFQQVDALQDTYQSVIGRSPGTSEYQSKLARHIAATDEWIAMAKAAVRTTEILKPSPSYPSELMPFTSHQDPTMLYNGMIHALVGFPIRGAIWYQGESNHGEGMLYFEKKKALVNGWRKLWGQGDFPFYYVQIAPFQYGAENPEILAEFWEAQAAAQQIPSAAMIVINDIATLQDIHPPNKQDVGQRLALLALKYQHGRNELVARSPEFKSLEVLDGSLKVQLRNTGGGLKTRDGQAPTHFEIVGRGSDGFHPATATIEGDSIVLKSDAVDAPTAFRFAWHKLAEPNLVGGTGLPVGAFRGGEVPEFIQTLPGGSDYVLVYELDLAKLARNIEYDVDRSSQVKLFDRIGYLLELESARSGQQKVFVSMDAFTDDVTKIGIPTVESKSRFQQTVNALEVFSNVDSLTAGTDIKTGNIEFWPDNYSAANGLGISGASQSVYDFGDDPGAPRDGYGSMQVHNYASGQTVFSVNHWKQGDQADIGIGNSPGDTRDWTFTGNAGSYSKKRLRVYVRPKQ